MAPIKRSCRFNPYSSICIQYHTFYTDVMLCFTGQFVMKRIQKQKTADIIDGSLINPRNDLLSHNITKQYHRRCIVLRLCSEWEEVVPMPYSHGENVFCEM